MNLRRGERGVCVCVLILYPPYIYSREPRVKSPPSSVNHNSDPMGHRHVARLRRWGPWASGPTREVGRPAGGTHHPQLPGVGLVWAWPCLNTGIELVLSGFGSVLGLHLVQLSLN